MIIVGIDPGSRITGFGVIKSGGSSLKWLEGGVIKPARDADLPDRLLYLHDQLRLVLERTSPDAVAMEECFMGRFAKAALVLGHARGALIVAALALQVPVFEYAPRLVKMAVTGAGGASKGQIQRMIPRLIQGAPESLSADEADAAAVAVCHNNRVIPVGAGAHFMHTLKQG